MRVLILNKLKFDKLMREYGISDENVEKQSSVFFISIVDTVVHHIFGLDASLFFNSSEWIQPYFKKDHDNVLNIAFDDVSYDGESSPTNKVNTKVFSKEQAKKIYEFIKKHKDKETCILHCVAGISRSGAVGLFVNDYYKSDVDRFKLQNPLIRPNPVVYKMLKDEWYNDNDLNN